MASRPDALSCYWLMLSYAPSSPAPSLGQCRRPPERPRPPLLHGTDAGIGSRGPPWHGAIRATPSLSTQTGPAPPREDATRTSGRESRGSGARHAGAGPHAGRGPHARRHGAAASPGGGWGGAREGEGRARRGSSRVRLSEGLRHALEEPLHICGNHSPRPPPHLGWLVAPRRLVLVPGAPLV